MLRKLVNVLILLCLGFLLLTPAAAQGVDLPDRVPANTVFYGEAVIDANLEANLNELLTVWAELSGDTSISRQLPISLDEPLQLVFPGKSFETDILPWLSGQVALAIFDTSNLEPQPDQDVDFVLLLPVTDSTRIQELIPPDAPEPIVRDDIRIFNAAPSLLFIGPDLIGVGTPRAIDATLAVNKGAQPTLGMSPAFQKTWDALPQDALATGYLNGSWLAAMVDQIPTGTSDIPPLDVLLQAVFKLHPAESAMEDALTQLPPLNGLGFAFELTADRLDVTVIMSLETQYPAPTLATATAGDRLLSYVPGDAFFLLDSYDATGTLGLGGGGVVGLALLGPAIGNVFDNIVYSLENPNAPTPTPRPTPTPPPPLTVEDITLAAQPVITQAELLLGITTEELYTLLAGEYAFALFNTTNPDMNNLGGAFWFLSPDPARLGEVVDRAMALLVAQISMGGPDALVRSTETVSGVEVNIWRDPQNTDGIAYGVLNGEVFFLTLESSLDKVLAASRGDGVLAQSPAWPGAVVASYGQGIDLLLYTNVAQIEQLASPSAAGQPARQINAVLSILDIQENGFFQLQLTLPRNSVSQGE